MVVDLSLKNVKSVTAVQDCASIFVNEKTLYDSDKGPHHFNICKYIQGALLTTKAGT